MARSTKGVLRGRPVDEHIRIDDDGHAVRVVDTHHRYGGFDAGASIAGALTALGTTVLLGGLLGGIGTIGYQLDLERGTDELSAAGLIGGIVTLIVAFLVGGWVAGRIARYDGGRNGLMTAVWFIFAALLLALLGAWLGDRYDVFQDLRVPQWFSDNATTATAIVSGVVAAVIMLGAGFAGGLIGARYHARADAYLAAEERDRFTGAEPIETTDLQGRRHVSGRGSPLATEPAPEVGRESSRDDAAEVGTSRDDERVRASTRGADERPADDAGRPVRDLGERTHTDRGW
jgi:hypothetical protein